MANNSDPTLFGHVTAVSGATIKVQMSQTLASGIAMINGHTYSVGQVGSFVRIPLGYQQLYGIVSEVGANETATTGSETFGARWLVVELAGEAIGGRFERGISQHPNINDQVHVVTEADLREIYGDARDDQIAVGTLASSENITVRLSLDTLVTRHSAILGSTGAGKSTTVASLLRSIICPQDNSRGSPAARVILIDIHGEYARAFSDIARVFSTNPQPDEEPLFVPYWALDADELLNLVTGDLSEPHEIVFTDRLQEMKVERVINSPLPGIIPASVTADSPIPFSLKRMWYELIDFETRTFKETQRVTPCLEAAGDPETMVAPRYKPHAMGNTAPFQNLAAKGVRRPLNLLRSRLLDRRYDFILRPGPWEPDMLGNVEKDLDLLLQGWLGHDRPLTILDLSGVPSSVLDRLIGSILRIIYDAIYWGREKTEGGILRPLLIVMEEAHRYIGPDSSTLASDIVKRIAKEGRKYGVGAMLVSQRPSEVDETVLSQCGTLISLRLSNPSDRARVRGALPDNLSGLTDLLPVLRTGEAIIVGEAARLPIRCRVTLPRKEHRPESTDPLVSVAWSSKRTSEGYDRMVASWRAQRTTAVVQNIEIDRIPTSLGRPNMISRDPVASSNVASIGYDGPSETLEVEFSQGSIYQYYNVPQHVYEGLMQSGSKGQYLHANIKNVYPYSKVG